MRCQLLLFFFIGGSLLPCQFFRLVTSTLCLKFKYIYMSKSNSNATCLWVSLTKSYILSICLLSVQIGVMRHCSSGFIKIVATELASDERKIIELLTVREAPYAAAHSRKSSSGTSDRGVASSLALHSCQALEFLLGLAGAGGAPLEVDGWGVGERRSW